MDIKDAFMNECSFPLVFYTINDYESRDLHLSISEKEYLCVELSVTLPPVQSNEHRDAHNQNESSSQSHSSAKVSPSSQFSDPTDAVAAITLDQDTSPFPIPHNYRKIVLFQGAVPFTSLQDVYQQKGSLASSPHASLRSSWNRLTGHYKQQHASGSPKLLSSSPTSNLIPPIIPLERTEFVMMKGPHGKGQCQVAIREIRSDLDEGDEELASTVVDTLPLQSPQLQPSFSRTATNTITTQSSSTSTLTDRLRMLGSYALRTMVGSSVPPPAPHPLSFAGSSMFDAPLSATSSNPPLWLKKPNQLRCSMTYVNVPWSSIIRFFFV